MRVAIITVAGISSRFNEGIPENEKKLKAIYTETDAQDTLLYHLLKKCSYADQIVVVGGYKFEDLYTYYVEHLSENFSNVVFVKNEHFADLSSGYSLYLGIKEAVRLNADEVLFVEGDLDIDEESFDKVIRADGDVLTYNYEPIYADKAVVLYKNDKEQFQYAFNSSHGMLTINAPFSCMLNSGQLWKFKDVDALGIANDKFYDKNKAGTNLIIIQNYIDARGSDKFSLVGLKRWTNCNTRQDYHNICTYWEEER